LLDIGSLSGFESIVLPGSIGTATGGELPISCCVLVNYTIPIRYRGGKPRSYVPGGTDSQTTNGRQWVSTFPALFLTAWKTVINAVVANSVALTGVTHASVQYFKGAEPESNPGTWKPANQPKPLVPPQSYPVIAYAVNPTIGTQRRRLTAG